MPTDNPSGTEAILVACNIVGNWKMGKYSEGVFILWTA